MDYPPVVIVIVAVVVLALGLWLRGVLAAADESDRVRRDAPGPDDTGDSGLPD